MNARLTGWSITWLQWGHFDVVEHVSVTRTIKSIQEDVCARWN